MRESSNAVILFAHVHKKRQLLYHNKYSLSTNNKILFRCTASLELLLLKLKDLRSLRYKTAAVSDKVREESRCFQTTQFLPAGFLISSSLLRIRSRFLRFLGQRRFKFPPPDTAKNAAVSSVSPKGRTVGSLAQVNCVENIGTASFTL